MSTCCSETSDGGGKCQGLLTKISEFRAFAAPDDSPASVAYAVEQNGDKSISTTVKHFATPNSDLECDRVHEYPNHQYKEKNLEWLGETVPANESGVVSPLVGT